jgi:hypothetical protein
MLSEALAFLNSNSGALMALFAAAVAVSTMVYAILAWGLISETRRLREAQTEPRIEITLKPAYFAADVVRLHIKNTGPGPARNVRFSSCAISGGDAAGSILQEFGKTGFLKNGLEYFSPGTELHSGYARIAKDFDAEAAPVFACDVEYENITGRKYRDRLTVDMSGLKGIDRLGRPDLYSIARSLEAIQNDLTSLICGNRKIRTDVYTAEDRSREEADELAFIEKLKRERKLREDAD